MLEHRKRKRVRSAAATSSDDDDTPEIPSTVDMVRQMRNIVYFHSEVTRKSVLDLLEKLEAAANYALLHECTDVKLFIHSEGGDALCMYA